MKITILIVFIAFCMGVLSAQQAQDSTFSPRYRHGINYQFITSTGAVFYGFVTNETAHYVTVENRDNHEVYELKRSEIVSAKRHSDRQSYAGEVLGENPHADSYMMTQSAFLFREGKLCANSHFLFVDNLSYGFNSNWALTANSIAFFYPASIGIKCAYQVSEEAFVGASVFGIGNVFRNGDRSPILGYGAIARFTKGTSNSNVTVMGGICGLASDMLVSNPVTPFTNLEFGGVSICRQMKKNLAITGEALYFPSVSFGLAGAGVKLVGNPNSCWTFGLYTILNQYNGFQPSLKTLPVPYFGISRFF